MWTNERKKERKKLVAKRKLKTVDISDTSPEYETRTIVVGRRKKKDDHEHEESESNSREAVCPIFEVC